MKSIRSNLSFVANVRRENISSHTLSAMELMSQSLKNQPRALKKQTFRGIMAIKDKIFCEICGAPAVRCHIKTQATFGSWEDFNIVHMCILHHTEQHKKGWYDFAQKYPTILKALRSRGWRFSYLFGVNKLIREDVSTKQT